MQRLTYIVLILALSGCGFFERTVDPPLRSAVYRFETRYNTTIQFPVLVVDDSRIKEINASDDPVGRCYHFPTRVFISRKVIEEPRDNVSQPKRIEALVFHELGHCQFHLGHDPSMMPIGRRISIPASLMHSTTPVGHYPDREQYYREELEEKINKHRSGDE